MLPSATDLPGGEHMLSHEVFDLLQDGPSFERLAEQSVVRGHGDRPGSENLARYKSQKGASPRSKIPSVLQLTFIRGWTQILCLSWHNSP